MSYVPTPTNYRKITLARFILEDVECMNLSNHLEQLDPSSAYFHTDLEGLDAYERQLRYNNIRINGPTADTLGAFYKDEASLTLFYEYVRRRFYKHLLETSEFKSLSKFTNLIHYNKDTKTSVIHLCNDLCITDKLKGNIPIDYSFYDTTVPFSFNLPDKKHKDISILDFDDYLKAEAQRLAKICFTRFINHLLSYNNDIYKVQKKELAKDKSALFKVYSGRQIDTIYCNSFDTDFVIKNLRMDNPTYGSIYHIDININNLIPKQTLIGLSSNSSIRINIGNDIIINPKTFFNDKVELTCYFDINTVDNNGLLLIKI